VFVWVHVKYQQCFSEIAYCTFNTGFEVLMFMLNMHQLAIAVVYRPPKPNKDFLNEFANFLGDIVVQYDRILIVGESFDFMQVVNA